MRKQLLIFLVLFLTSCGTPSAPPPSSTPAEVAIVETPSLSCEQFITEAISRVGSTCDALDRNQVCYGNQLVDIEFREGSNETFQSAGDIVPLSSIASLQTYALNNEAQQWGIAIIKAQANLPETLPGQNVTFLIMGDASVENPSNEMSAVTIKTGVGEIECEGAPQSSVMVQSPGGSAITMNINGASVTMGSTVYITAVENQDMTVATIEGYAEVEAFGVVQRVEPGAQVELPLEAEQVSGPPSEPQPFEVEIIEAAPVTLLERPVEIPSPLPPQPTTDAPAETTQGATNTPALTSTPRLTNTPRPTGTATDIPSTAAPVGPNLRADATTISAGQCTIIRWEQLEGIRQIYFDGQPTNSTQREVCPSATRTYTLLVIGEDNAQTPYNITITVE